MSGKKSAYDELKPCPFCNAPAKAKKGYFKDGWHPPKVICENGHIFRIISPEMADMAQKSAAKTAVIAAWNKRPESSEVAKSNKTEVPAIETVQEILQIIRLAPENETINLDKSNFDAEFLTETFVSYLVTKNATPGFDGKFIEYQKPDSWGTGMGQRHRITVRKNDQGYLIERTLAAMLTIIEEFEEKGKIRTNPHEIDGRTMSEFAKGLMEIKAGENWRDVLQDNLKIIYARSQIPFATSYQNIEITSKGTSSRLMTRQSWLNGEKVQIRFYGDKIAVGMPLGNGNYRDGIVTIKGLPESVMQGMDAMVGKSISEIVGGLPEWGCFRDTKVARTKKLINTIQVILEEKQSPVEREVLK